MRQLFPIRNQRSQVMRRPSPAMFQPSRKTERAARKTMALSTPDGSNEFSVVQTGSRRTKADQMFSKRVREKRNALCESCNRSGLPIVAHQVLEYSLFPELRFVEENILTILRPVPFAATEAEKLPQTQALFYADLPS
jgi:hypothetical protein